MNVFWDVQYNKMSLKQILYLILKDPSIIKFLQTEIILYEKQKVFIYLLVFDNMSKQNRISFAYSAKP